MDRRPTAQDITWFLDLEKNGQLDLEPPYQRRSVWTAKDRRFFLDTVFRNYPSPAVFLHKEIADNGSVTYHVVDGKQRLQTILSFVSNKIRMAPDFGDARLDGKRWKDISNETELKRDFWNYQITVEQIDAKDGDLVNAVFDRLNRNSRKLTQQELRHAKFDGWFVQTAETEADSETWRKLGVASRARSKRMMDVQFISELIMVVISKTVVGFDQELIDSFYADYDDLEEEDSFDEEEFRQQFEVAKGIVGGMEMANQAVTRWAKAVGHFYSLWAVVVLTGGLPEPAILAARYDRFMQKVAELDGLPPQQAAPAGEEYTLAATYRENARGASTELPQRLARNGALGAAMHLK